MKFIAIYITNNATAYGGVKPLRQVVLFVWLGNPIVYKGNGKVMQKYTPSPAKEEQVEKKDTTNKGIDKSVLLISIILAIFALFHNFAKDGLQTWVPAILKESYNVSDRLSIILSFVLSALSIFGSSVITIRH